MRLVFKLRNKINGKYLHEKKINRKKSDRDSETRLVLLYLGHQVMHAEHFCARTEMLEGVVREDFVESVIILNQLSQSGLRLPNETILIWKFKFNKF